MTPSRRRAHRWYPGRDKISGLRFRGAPQLVELIDDLLRRPLLFGRDRPLPILFLDRPDAAPSPLDALADRLDSARGRQVPFACVGTPQLEVPKARGAASAVEVQPPVAATATSLSAAPQAPEAQGAAPLSSAKYRSTEAPSNQHSDVDRLRPLLDDAVAQLASKVHGSAPLRFPHYCLVSWMAKLEIPANASRDQEERQIARQLRDHLRTYRFAHGHTGVRSHDFAGDFPWWVRLAIALVPRLGLILTALLWRPPRWVGHQRVAGPARSSFYGLARSFARDDLATRRPADVGQLLVSAFLEDLRRGYRRTGLWGAGRRRSGHPVLLVEDARPGSASYELLSVLGKVRSNAMDAPDTRRPDRPHKRLDPLLVIASGRWDGDAPADDPADAWTHHLDWQQALHRDGRSRAWALPLRVDATRPASGVGGTLAAMGPLRFRRTYGGVVAAVLLVAAVISVPVFNNRRCDPWWSLALTSPLSRTVGECVGVSADPIRDFLEPVSDRLPADLRDHLADAYRAISAQRPTDAAPGTPAVKPPTVIYLGDLTPADASSYQALVEELRGIILAQQLVTPRVRVLLANAGRSLGHGKVAAKRIKEWAARDDSVIAVVGISASYQGSGDAIAELGSGEHPLPVIGTITSATDLPRINNFYHQVGPDNRREAQVIAYYLSRTIGAKRVHVYHSDEQTSLFSKDLGTRAEEALRSSGIEVTSTEYSYTVHNGSIPDAQQAAEQACAEPVGQRPDALLFAGLADHLDPFLNGLARACQGRPPVLMGGDSVSRFVLGGGLVTHDRINLDYVSFATPSVWTNCQTIQFYQRYADQFGVNCTSMNDGRAALAYDTVVTVTEAIRRVRAKDANAALAPDLNAQLSQVGRDQPVVGAGGILRYATSGAVPDAKAIIVLRAVDDGVTATPTIVTPQLLCGAFTADPDPTALIKAPDPGC